jgi:hypothetical protein
LPKAIYCNQLCSRAGCSVARYSRKLSHVNYDGSFGTESWISKLAPTSHVTPSGCAFEKRFDGGVAHNSIRLRKARQTTDRYRAASTKKRRTAIRNTLPQRASLDPAPVVTVRLQTLPNTAVGTHARSIDPALILLTGVDASFNFDFNDYLHNASLCAAPPHCATLSERSIPDLFHFRHGNFLTASIIIVSSVSANSLRAPTPVSPRI